jgi:hypothetical protein
MVGVAATTSLAVLESEPAPLCVLVTPVAVAGWPPAGLGVPLVTRTVTVQLAPAASAPPEKPTLAEPAGAVTAPPQVFVTPGAAATCTFESGAVKAMPLRGVAPPFVIVKERVVVPPCWTSAGRIAAATLGGWIAAWLSVALAAAALLTFRELVSAPAGMVFV